MKKMTKRTRINKRNDEKNQRNDEKNQKSIKEMIKRTESQ
jgi:hypothetical protein